MNEDQDLFSVSLDFLLAFGAQFWIAVALGCFVISLFAIDEFDKPTFHRDAHKPETKFTPQELTTRREYLISFFLYLFGLELVYIALCVIGPAPFTSGLLGGEVPSSDELVHPPSFPLWLALVMVGIVPRLPVVSYLEQGWRRLLHERAAIPSTAITLARRMRMSSFDIEPFSARVISGGADLFRSVLPGDLLADSRSTSYKWARLSALVDRMQEFESMPAAVGFVGLDFLERYRGEFDAIVYAHKSLSNDIANSRNTDSRATHLVAANGLAESSSVYAINPDETPLDPVPDLFQPVIHELLDRAYAFIACALIARQPSKNSLRLAMLRFGFAEVDEPNSSNETDVIAVALFMLFAISFVVVVLAPMGLYFVPDHLREGWPSHSNQALIYSLSATLMHGASIFAALSLRRYLRQRVQWFRGHPDDVRLPGAVRYLAIIILSFLIGLIVLYYWDMALFGTWSAGGLETLKRVAPFAFLPAASGFFCSLLLDHAYLGRSVGVGIVLVLVQAITTAFFGWVAASTLNEIVGAVQPGSALFTAMFGGLIGLTLGFVVLLFPKGKKRES